MLKAINLTYPETITVNMLAEPIDFTDTEFIGHRVKCNIAKDDINLYFKWSRAVGSERPVGYVQDISGFCACLDTAFIDGFVDLDGNSNSLSFTSGILANSYNITNSVNDIVMAYVLYKVFGKSAFNTNKKLYNISTATHIVTNSNVYNAIGTSISSHNSEGDAVDLLFRDLLVANPTRFFNQNTGVQIPGIFETNPTQASSGDWKAVVGDIIELNIIFVFKAPISRIMAPNGNNTLQNIYVMIPTDDTFQIRLQMTATASRTARRIAQLELLSQYLINLKYVTDLDYLQITNLPFGETISSIDISLENTTFTVYNNNTNTYLLSKDNIPLIYRPVLGGYKLHPAYTYNFTLADLVNSTGNINYTSGNNNTVTIGTVATVPFSIQSINNIITGFLGPIPTVLTIPSNYTEIQSTRFMDTRNNSMEQVILPSTFTNIGPSTFYKNYNLTSINFPDGLLAIGNAAFSVCEALSLTSLPASISSIGAEAFANCESLYLDTCPPNITTIENQVFQGTQVSFSSIPSAVNRIGDLAFNGCSQITEMICPEDLLAIGDGAFSGCSGLSNIYIPQTISSLGSSAFLGTALSTLTWNFAISEIPDYTFWSGNNLTSFDITSSIVSIGAYAFGNCSLLPNITLPPNVTTLKTGAYSGCASFTTVFIPSTITTLQGAVFQNCTNLLDATIESPLTSLLSLQFQGCTSLHSVTLPDSIVSFENNVFNECTSLITMTLPSSITEIGAAAFNMCIGLSSIVFTSVQPPTMQYNTLNMAGNVSSVAVYPTGPYNSAWESTITSAGWTGTIIAV